jgi:hypothetical protein
MLMHEIPPACAFSMLSRLRYSFQYAKRRLCGFCSICLLGLRSDQLYDDAVPSESKSLGKGRRPDHKREHKYTVDMTVIESGHNG